MIDISRVDLKEFAKKVYELSVPQGYGFLHAKPGPLSDEVAEELVNRYKKTNHGVALSMDYVSGCACKMTVFRENENLTIHDNWYDHTDAQFDTLLSSSGVERLTAPKHGGACNCSDCQKERR